MTAFAGPLIGAGLSLGGSLLGGNRNPGNNTNAGYDTFWTNFGRYNTFGGRPEFLGADYQGFLDNLTTIPGIEESFGLDSDFLFNLEYRPGRNGEDQLHSITAPLGGREFQRILALGEIPQLEQAYANDIIPFADSFASDILNNRGSGFDSVLGTLDRDIASADAAYQQSINSLEGLQSARAALDARTNDIVRNASETAALNASTRGLGSSSIPLSQIVNNVLPEVIDSRLQADAALEQGYQQSRSNALANRANALSNLAGVRAGIGSQFAGDRTGEYLFSQLLGLRQAPVQARFGTLAQPSEIFGDTATRSATVGGARVADPTASQRIGSQLGDLGGLILGQSLFGSGGFFGG